MTSSGERSVEARLDNIEKLLGALAERVSITGGLPRRPPVVDPAPLDMLNLRVLDLISRLRLRDLLVHVSGGGFTDPSPEDWANLRLRDLAGRIPGGGFTDPSPEDLSNLRIRDLLRRVPGGGFSDPSPEDFGSMRLGDLLKGIPGGGFTDPSPEDLKRLSDVELETRLNQLNTEITRLNSLQQMLSQRLSEIRPK